MQKGHINVATQNIFPIIKKYLYSEHDIFLREIVSNAVDATQKLKKLASVGEFSGELGDLTIAVSVDSKKKTITVSDKGIGMTEEEVNRYINELAFSSANDFLEKYKDQSIIGHFGLGFYSSFMVSKKVEVITRSFKEGAEAVKWSCEGDPEFTLEKTQKDGRGTDIIMYLDDDSKEFGEESKVEELLNKFCKFLPIPIQFGKEKEWKEGEMEETDRDKIINDTEPLWTKAPADLKEEDYKDFYRKLYPMADEPLFHIHLFVDYPFNLNGILYFPKIKNKLEIHKDKIQLYCNQVFVTDSVEGIVPEFLTLLHGVIDSPDIPLNISRSYLQTDSNVRKISSHINKKVADKLHEIFKNDRPEFEKKWDDLKIFIEYGMLSDEKFYERAEKFLLLKNSTGKYFTMDEYKELIKSTQTNHQGDTICLYTTDKEKQHSYIEEATAKGYDILLMDGYLDAPFINHIEQKLEKVKFVRVDADIVENLIQKEENKQAALSDNERQQLAPLFESQLPKEKGHFIVGFEKLGKQSMPVVITQSEFMRRMKDMSEIGGGGMNFYGEMPDSYNLVVNLDHDLTSKIIQERDNKMGNELKEMSAQLASVRKEMEDLNTELKDKKEEEIDQVKKDQREELSKKESALLEKQKKQLEDFGQENKLVKQIVDLALLSNNMLSGEELTKFVKRSVALI